MALQIHDREEQLSSLLAELRRQWEIGDRTPVECYFEQHPWLRQDVVAAVELILHEWLLRQDFGEQPRLEEFIQRFPQHVGPLRTLLLLESIAKADETAQEWQTLKSPVFGNKQRAPGELLAAKDRQRPVPHTSSTANLPTPPGYEILNEVGRGGMGVVYRARQTALNRIVALKMIRSGPQAGTDDLLRFRLEGESIARLHHPHIGQIYEMGEWDGVPFFSLEYVEGGSLAERLDGTPQPPEHVAKLVACLADAVQAAHDRGIIHRDLKPGNILGTEVPKIVDFGLAKLIDGENSPASVSLGLIGTPMYMAPEQAAGNAKDIGPAVDIYALGAVMYELLVGRPPFKGATIYATLDQVRREDPVSPSRLVPGLPRDLETICLKCLHKEPKRRYTTAVALADDLRRFLTGRPIEARKTPWWERGLKWSRREPRIAALITVVVLVVLGALLTTTIQWQLVETARHVAVERGDAEAKQRRLVEHQLYLNRIALANRELQVGRTAWAREQLDRCPPAQRHWEWHHLHGRCEGSAFSAKLEGHTRGVSSVAFHRNGHLLASGSGDRTVRLWDIATGKTTHVLSGHISSVNGVAFSPHDMRLASVGDDGQAIVWDAMTGEQRTVLTGFSKPLSCVAFHPRTGELIAGTFESTGPGEILVWSKTDASSTGSASSDKCPPHRILQGHQQRISSLAFDVSGRRLCSGSHDHTVRVWDFATGQELLTFREHALPVSIVAASPVSNLVASGAGRLQAERPEESEILVWDCESGRIVHRLRGHQSRPMAMAFTPDGLRLATAGWDQEIRLWDVSTGQEILSLSGHTGAIMSLAFTSNSEYLASASLDTTLQIWHAPPNESATH